jgi:hypothetical protein
MTFLPSPRYCNLIVNGLVLGDYGQRRSTPRKMKALRREAVYDKRCLLGLHPVQDAGTAPNSRCLIEVMNPMRIRAVFGRNAVVAVVALGAGFV